MKKKRNSLKPSHNNRNRKDYIDYDYINKLNPEELQFLETFTGEYYGGDFKKNDTYILENGKYVQISGNKDKSNNRDLRKYVSQTKYYKTDSGKFTKDVEYKYKDSVLHKSQKSKRELWTVNNHRNVDMIASGIIRDNASNTLHLDILGLESAISTTHFDEIKPDLISLLKLYEIYPDSDISDDDVLDLINSLIKTKDKDNVKLLEDVRDIISD